MNVIVTATKSDQRKQVHVPCVSKEDGERLKRKIKAADFIECSAKTGDNLKPIFEAAVRAAQKRTKNPIVSSKCRFL